jgi:hypothetical protein
MPVESYRGQLEPRDQGAIIWRFMNLEKFRDLMTSGELYFCRADQFDDNDEREGLPPEEFLKRWGLSPYDLNDRRQLVDHIGTAAQFREEFYVSCWHLFAEEKFKMWEKYGKDGVAICSRYSLLKAALDLLPDSAHIGLVRYESSFMEIANLFSYITNKRPKYAWEQEVRALLWIHRPERDGNRHIDGEDRVHPHVLEPPPEWIPKGQRRAVDLNKLITRITITPLGPEALTNEVIEIVKNSGYQIPVAPSEVRSLSSSSSRRNLVGHSGVGPIS